LRAPDDAVGENPLVPTYADAREPVMAWFRQVRANDRATPADGDVRFEWRPLRPAQPPRGLGQLYYRDE
jgi:hypothetical protein